MLRAVFYAEFHNLRGSEVLYDAPLGAVSGRSHEDVVGGVHSTSGHHPCLFDAITDYSITGPQLSGHLITVRVPAHTFARGVTFGSPMGGAGGGGAREEGCAPVGGGSPRAVGGGNGLANGLGGGGSEVQVVNFPLAISSHEAGRSYHRNALLFNVGLVLHQDAPAQLFTSVLRKLALTLRAMELESAFLSDPSKKVAIADLLPRLLRDLNGPLGECTLPLDGANLLNLKLPCPPPTVVNQLTAAATAAARAARANSTLAAEAPPARTLAAESTAVAVDPSGSSLPAASSAAAGCGASGGGGGRREGEGSSRNSSNINNAAGGMRCPAAGSVGGADAAGSGVGVPTRGTSSGGGGAWEEVAFRLSLRQQLVLPEVKEHHVPSLLVDPILLKGCDWDLALRRVVPHIDGVKCVKMVAMEAAVDVSCCQRCLRALLWHKCVVLLDLFAFSNVYALRPSGVAALLSGGQPIRGRQKSDKKRRPTRARKVKGPAAGAESGVAETGVAESAAGVAETGVAESAAVETAIAAAAAAAAGVAETAAGGGPRHNRTPLANEETRQQRRRRRKGGGGGVRRCAPGEWLGETIEFVTCHGGGIRVGGRDKASDEESCGGVERGENGGGRRGEEGGGRRRGEDGEVRGEEEGRNGLEGSTGSSCERSQRRQGEETRRRRPALLPWVIPWSPLSETAACLSSLPETAKDQKKLNKHRGTVPRGAQEPVLTKQQTQQKQRQQQQQQLSPRDIVDFFLSFGSGKTVKEVVLSDQNKNSENSENAKSNRFSVNLMDHRRVLAFGVLHGIVARVHVFPVLADLSETPAAAAAATAATAAATTQSPVGDGQQRRRRSSSSLAQLSTLVDLALASSTSPHTLPHTWCPQPPLQASSPFPTVASSASSSSSSAAAAAASKTTTTTTTTSKGATPLALPTAAFLSSSSSSAQPGKKRFYGHQVPHSTTALLDMTAPATAATATPATNVPAFAAAAAAAAAASAAAAPPKYPQPVPFPTFNGSGGNSSSSSSSSNRSSRGRGGRGSILGSGGGCGGGGGGASVLVSAAVENGKASSKKRILEVAQAMNGAHSLDALAVRFFMSPREVVNIAKLLNEAADATDAAEAAAFAATTATAARGAAPMPPGGAPPRSHVPGTLPESSVHSLSGTFGVPSGHVVCFVYK